MDSFRDFRVSWNPEVRDAFNRDLESVKSHYIFGDSDYLKKELEKKGVKFDGGSNPGGSAGKMTSRGQALQIGVSVMVGAVLAIMVRAII